MFNRTETSGFSLIEMVIAITLVAILSGILISIIAVNFTTIEEVSDRKKLVTRGMQALNLFQREFGLIRHTDDIMVATSSQFKFVDVYENTWDYTISGNSLFREQVGGGGGALTLASPILNSDTEFSYFAEDNSTTSNISEIRLVKLMLVMDDGSTGIPLMSVVYPENMKVYNYPLD